MKEKQIKHILKSRFDDFVDSIDDERIKNIVRNETFITGGAIVSLLLDEKIHDLDIYFRNINSAYEVARYYVNKFEATHVDVCGFRDILERRDKDGVIIDIDYNYGIITEKDFKFNGKQNEYRPIAFSQNAITIKKPSTKVGVSTKTVQLILRFVGSPKEIHSNYDFIHCTNMYIPASNELILNKKAVTSILTKELHYMGSKYPIASIIRTRKYISRGWAINAGQYLKMVFQVSDFDLRDINVLRDQLIGVDAMYFLLFIEKLNDKNLKEMDSTVICQLIDEIFDNFEEIHDDEEIYGDNINDEEI